MSFFFSVSRTARSSSRVTSRSCARPGRIPTRRPRSGQGQGDNGILRQGDNGIGRQWKRGGKETKDRGTEGQWYRGTGGQGNIWYKYGHEIKVFFYGHRKKALTDNLTSWEVFEEKKVECHKHLDIADQEFEAIKKIFDLVAGIVWP